MAGTRQPTDLVLAKGRKHLTKKEVADRKAAEIRLEKPKSVKIPPWLPKEPAELRATFRKLAKALIAADYGYSDLDADTLGRYVVAQHEYEKAWKLASDAIADGYRKDAEAWTAVMDKYFKQAHTCANDLGLTITSRCRLVLPDSAQKKEENPFEMFLIGGERRA